MSSGFKIEMVVPGADVSPWSEALDPLAVAIAAFEIVPGGAWRIEAYTVDEPDAGEVHAALAAVGPNIPAYRIEPLPSVDWLAENRRSFPPLKLGRFFIHGSHVSDVPPGRIGLLIDAATAFGSGEHPTTRGCLALMSALAKRRPIRRPLDVGSGSGILAIAAAKLWRVPVAACDIDRESVRVATGNARLNQVASLVRVARSDGLHARAIDRRRDYDLIVANILARPLCRLAPEIADHLDRRGTIILSGLLNAQETQVFAAYRAQGFHLRERWQDNGWSALQLER